MSSDRARLFPFGRGDVDASALHEAKRTMGSQHVLWPRAAGDRRAHEDGARTGIAVAISDHRAACVLPQASGVRAVVPESDPTGCVNFTPAETARSIEVVAGERRRFRRWFDAGIRNGDALLPDCTGLGIGRAQLGSASENRRWALISDIEAGGVGCASVVDDLTRASAHLRRIRRTAGGTFFT